MRARRFSSLLLSLLLLQSALLVRAQHAVNVNVPKPPKTRTEPVTEIINGVRITDPYRWLEDQDAPATRAWIDEQNRYTQSILGSLPGRDAIHKRMEQLLRVDFIDTPRARGNRYFFRKRRADQNQAVIYLREGLAGQDEVLIDPNSMSADQTTSVSISNISDDGKLLLYAVRRGGEDETELHIMDVDARRDLSDVMPRARYSNFALKPDNSGFFYSKYLYGANRQAVGPRVYYHQMGTKPSQDAEIFGKQYGPTEFLSPDVSIDGRWLILYVNHGSSGDRDDLFAQNLAENGQIFPVVEGLHAGFQGAEVVNNHFFLMTNYEAPNWRVIDIDLKNPKPANWRTVVPEGTSVITDFSMVGGKLFVNYLENVNSRIKVFDPSGRLAREIKLPGLSNATLVSGRWDRDEAFYSFNSFAQPTTIYRYVPSSGAQTQWARINVPVDSSQIETKQVWYTSRDGTRVPMYLVYKKGLRLDGNRPVYLTGYGGFNLTRTPTFSPTAVFWVEHGGVFAQPNLRGGGEFGERWHQAGMFQNKQNVFDDFLSAAEWLIKNKYTNPSKLAISGGSNGGLLVGAALTQRPDLFQAVVCSYPLLDMVRYHKFLVARFWTTEYGSADDPTQFPYIYKYSPYHNVKPGVKYPAVLFITGDSDTRVAPLHARKMAALLQASTGSDRPILLHYDTKAGHSGGLPVSKQIDDATDTLSFLMWQLGMLS